MKWLRASLCSLLVREHINNSQIPFSFFNEGLTLEDVILTAWLKLHRANLVTECDDEVHYACEHKAKGAIPVITTQWVLDCVKQEQILDI